MILKNDHGIINLYTPILQTAASTHRAVFSKMDANGQPYGHANIFFSMGTVSTNADALSEILVYESDTVTTPTSMATILSAFSFTTGTATDATHANAWTLGAAGAGLGGIVEFQMDLRKRKKYIGFHVLAASNVVTFSAMALLGRGAESRDSAADANQYGGVYGNLAATNARGCIARVIG